VVERRPGDVPDDEWPPSVAGGFDTDGDGRADTVVTDDGIDLILLTDLDRDGFADQILRIGPDGVVRELDPEPAPGPTGADIDRGFGGGGSEYEL
jgi:hypothetical protein